MLCLCWRDLSFTSLSGLFFQPCAIEKVTQTIAVLSQPFQVQVTKAFPETVLKMVKKLSPKSYTPNVMCSFLWFCQVLSVGRSFVRLHWIPPPESPHVEYCLVYHRASDHKPEDTHSSSYSEWMERPSAKHARCTREPQQNIYALRPGTEYHIDLLARDTKTLREATFMGVIVMTRRAPVNTSPWKYQPLKLTSHCHACSTPKHLCTALNLLASTLNITL